MSTFKGNSLKLIASGSSGRQSNTGNIDDKVKDFPDLLTQTEISDEKLARRVQFAIRDLLLSDEFHEMLGEIIDEKVRNIVDELLDEFDPDEGQNLRPEFEKYLKGLQQQKQHYTDAADVWRELGLDE